MKESDLESVLAKYPDLIEAGLILRGRQVTVYGRRMDLLFDDEHKRKLIVELKAGPIKDEHIGQILSYEGMLLSADNPDIRVKLVGTRVPPNIRKTLDHHGIGWKEIKLTSLKEFLANKGDNQFDNLFEDEIYPSVKMAKNETNNNAYINSTKGGIMEGNTQQAPLRLITPRERIDIFPDDIKKVYLEMQKRAMTFGADVLIYANQIEKSLCFKARYTFAEILYQPKKGCLRVLIRRECFDIPENTSVEVYGITVTRVPDKYLWVLDLKLELNKNSPMDGVEKLLRQSYKAVSETA